jgi:tRNA (guanine-N7-)-methyltransferase
MSEPKHPSGAPWRNFHGRLRGKTMNRAAEERLETDLAALSPGAVSWEENPDRAPLDLAARFPGAHGVWLEIGFGGGEHMVAMAARYPQVAVIGAEPYLNGVAQLLGKIRAAQVTNLAVHPGDVRDLFDVLPPASIARAFLNYPDPWPKKRHHKRRFVTQDHLAPLMRVLAPGAEFRVATDIADYVRQTLEEVPRAGFQQVDHPMDAAWPDWPSTRYEQKALREGRTPHYLTFLKP